MSSVLSPSTQPQPVATDECGDIHSSKLKSIMLKCDEKETKGSPRSFKLTTKIEINGPLKKVTFGEKKTNKKNKTILLVGETGAGKSKMVDVLLNYSMGVTFEDEVWFQITEDEKKSQTQSQTSDVIVYEIFGFENEILPYSLTIIDTPGYGSTDGKDHNICLRLLDLFRSPDGVREINVVGLVVKASECRLSDRLVYIFNSVMSLFGNDMEKNIVTLITYSNGITPVNVIKALEDADIKCARNEKNEPVHFLFDNCQNRDRAEKNEILKHIYKLSETEMKALTAFLGNMKPQAMEKSMEVIKEHIQLSACIQNLQDRIMLITLKQAELKQTQEALKKHEEDMKNNEKFTVEVDEVYKVRQRIDGGLWGLAFYEGAVCCTFCEENCHYPGCTVAWYPRDCSIIKRGRCTACTRRCLTSAHVKEQWFYVTRTRKVKKTLTDVKKRYEKNQSASVVASNLLDSLQKEIENLDADKEKWLDMACQHVDRLNEIALKVDSVSTYAHMQFLIEKIKEKGDTERFRNMKKKMNQVNEAVKNGAMYLQKRFTRNKDGNGGTEL